MSSPSSSSSSSTRKRRRPPSPSPPRWDAKKKPLMQRSQQTESQRIKLRKDLRDLQKDFQEQRNEIESTRRGTKIVKRFIEKSDDLNQRILFTSESRLDLENLSQIGGSMVKNAQTILNSALGISVDDFMDGLAKFIDNDGIDFEKLAKFANPLIDSAPSVIFMNGPIQVDIAAKKTRKKAQRLQKKQSVAQQAEVLKENKEEKTMTDARVEFLHETLSDKYEEGIPLFEFLVNPDSFGQTVENFFDLSFLIKEGKAAIRLEGKEPFVSPGAPPSEQEFAKGAHGKQCIMKFNQKMYRDLVDTYQITESQIPTRPSSGHNDEAASSSSSSSQMIDD